MYQWKCPVEIKLAESATDYVGRYFQHISGVEEFRVERALAEGDQASKDAYANIQKALEAAYTPPRAVPLLHLAHPVSSVRARTSAAATAGLQGAVRVRGSRPRSIVACPRPSLAPALSNAPTSRLT